MTGNSLAEAYKNKSIVAGDLLSIKTDGEIKKFIYMCYLQDKSVHWLFSYPLPEGSLMAGYPTFYRDDDIKEWKKIGHITPEELEKMKEEKV